MAKTRAVVLLSGGLDSTTLAYYVRDTYKADLITLSFDYGQRHKKELEVAERIALGLKSEHHIIRIGASFYQTYEDHESPKAMIKSIEWGPFGDLLGGSALTDSSVPVPDGHYAEETMKATIVPNRNAIMLSLAYAVAIAGRAEYVIFGAHAGDHAIYPDCRVDFILALDNALKIGNSWDHSIDILAPFIQWSKQQIVTRAYELGVPIAETWSCYKGGAVHCGVCGTCQERREAFKLANAEDPTVYEDSETVYAAPS